MLMNYANKKVWFSPYDWYLVAWCLYDQFFSHSFTLDAVNEWIENMGWEKSVKVIFKTKLVKGVF